MAELFASGRFVDLILVLVAVEAALLAAWRIYRPGQPSMLALASNLASGAALMVALRAALTGADWTTLAAWLTVALAAHATDLWTRLRPTAA